MIGVSIDLLTQLPLQSDSNDLNYLFDTECIAFISGVIKLKEIHFQKEDLLLYLLDSKLIVDKIKGKALQIIHIIPSQI